MDLVSAAVWIAFAVSWASLAAGILGLRWWRRAVRMSGLVAGFFLFVWLALHALRKLGIGF